MGTAPGGALDSHSGGAVVSASSGDQLDLIPPNFNRGGQQRGRGGGRKRGREDFAPRSNNEGSERAERHPLRHSRKKHGCANYNAAKEVVDAANFSIIRLINFMFLLLRALRYGKRPPSILREVQKLPVFAPPAKIHVKRPCSRSQASERDKLGEDAETLQLQGDFVGKIFELCLCFVYSIPNFRYF